MIDLHTHSLASGHALNTVYELINTAKEKGISMIGITEHGPSMKGAPHEEYFWISQKLDSLFGVKVMLGVEANILDNNGDIDLNEDYLKIQKVVSAGIHEYTPYKFNTIKDNTESIINAMKNPRVKIITHPYRPEFPVNLKIISQYSIKTNTLLELNNQLFARDYAIKEIIDNYKIMIDELKKYNFPVLLGSDAHVAKDIGNFEKILKYKKTLGITDELIINNYENLLSEYLNNDKQTVLIHRG